MDKEKQMLFNIDQNVNSEFFLELLRNNYERYHNIHYLGQLIGEFFIHHVIHKDGYGFEFYITEVEKLYNEYREKNISPEQFYFERSKLIAIVIANKLNIDITKEIEPESIEMVRNYFLQEYVTNGYVTHSFPEAYFDSIMKDGLIGSTEDRKEKPKDIMEIQSIFMRKGVVSPMGGYPYYGGSGIYFEHDFTKVFQHAIDSPEWFNWFTSSDHSTVYHTNVEPSPYILRSEPDCRRNVMDLCTNAGLSEEETERVLSFYEQQYSVFSSPKLNVALIPKKVVGKDSIEQTGVHGLGVIETIMCVLSDKSKQYTEHNGNVYEGTIEPSKFVVANIPEASRYMYANEYERETEEHLTDPRRNMAVIENAENNKHRLVPYMVPEIEIAKEVIKKKPIVEPESRLEEAKTPEMELNKPKTLALRYPNRGAVSISTIAVVIAIIVIVLLFGVYMLVWR